MKKYLSITLAMLMMFLFISCGKDDIPVTKIEIDTGIPDTVMMIEENTTEDKYADIGDNRVLYINGDKKTGITIMYMDKRMDSGDIISQEELPIEENDTLDIVYEKMSLLGANLLIKTLPSIIEGTNQRIKQDENEVTYGLNITKEEEKIDFNQKSKNIHNRIRGLSSIPGAYCFLDDKRLKIYQSELTTSKSSDTPGTITKIDKTGIYVSTNDLIIKITDIKLEGKKRCLVKDFINGIRPEEYIGKVLK